MNIKPILFSTPMAKALSDGRKTMTRRVQDRPDEPIKYRVSDLLWVREPWQTFEILDDYSPSKLVSSTDINYLANGNKWDSRYRHARFMCRWMSRMTLEVTDVKIERLQDISEEDAIAEGLCHAPKSAIDLSTMKFAPGFRYQDGSFSNLPGAYKRAWLELWSSIHGPDAWDKNPWVSAISFKAHKINVDDLHKGREAP